MILLWVLLAISIIGFIAAIVASFFVENGGSDLSRLRIKGEIDEDADEKISFSFFDDSSKKKHSGKCDGDCANCPPHCGYRHGRWYYGHSHSEGCVFGGNKCNGGRD